MTKDKKPPLFVDEPYTCVSCGKNNLKFEEIVWFEDKEGQIDVSTVKCLKCWWLFLYPHLAGEIIPGKEKEIEEIIKKHIKQFEHNYNRRTFRRATKK
jgi:hypothetical protein